METLILPGFSIKNKDWAEEIQKSLSSEISLRIHYWPHWETGQAQEGWIDNEVEKIIKNENSPINVIAKSIGTLVAVKVLALKPDLIGKIILCGIPLNDFHPGDEKFYEILRVLDEEKILCIQNENDNHGSFSDVEKFVHLIKSEVKIISKPRSDHDYPYPKDFIEFLKIVN